MVYYDTDSCDYQYAHRVNVGTDTSCTVSDLSAGIDYYLAVTTYDIHGNESDRSGPEITTGIEHVSYPKKVSLYQNIPNPFNPSTTIAFTLPKQAKTNLSVYNVEGKLVTTILDETLDAGFKEVTWNGKDARGNQVSTGVYFYRLTAGNRTLTKKMVLLK